MNPKPKKLLDRVRDTIRLKQYSNKTEWAYLIWIKQYILFHDKKHPQCMGASEVEAFLTYLAVERKVAASTQNQALSAILFLYRYREVLGKPVETGFQYIGAKRQNRLPAVLTKSEVQQILIRLSGDTKLVVGRQPHSYASMRPKARSCVTASSVRWPRHSSLACSHTSG
jgi:site-specific recombinase XerD